MTHAATKPLTASRLEPRFENRKALLIAGSRKDYTPESINDLPSQWLGFIPHIGKIPGQIGRATYGVCWCPDDAETISYLCGVEVSNFSSLPGDFTIVGIPPQKYAVFTHGGHISTIRETIEAVGSNWFPQSGCEPAARAREAPDFYERYTEDFDPRTGMGGMEIWFPLKS